MVDPLGDLHEQFVAGRMAPAVVDDLEAVEVEEEDRVLGAVDGLAGERLRDARGEESAVRQPGERVVVGLVAELLLQLGHLRQRALEPSVLEQHARVARERLEQGEVLVGERGHVAHPVTHHEDAEHPLIAAQSADDRVRESTRLQEIVQRVRVAPPGEEQRVIRRTRPLKRELGDRRERLGMHEQLARGATHAS